MSVLRRSRPHAWLASAVLALALCLGVVGAAATAQAASAAPDPAGNLQMGALPFACYGLPLSSACEIPIIGYLDAAREALGFGPYVLPVDFQTLAPGRQLFILVNLDRRAYSLPLISGLSPQLDTAAEAGAAVEQDPAAPSADRAVWASSWAAGLVNVLAAYYQWMYSDGWPGLNIDCPSPGATGCWVHRHGILFAFARSVKLTMGAAVATDQSGRPVVGMLIAATGRATGPGEDYTWAQAEADGAGRVAGTPIRVPALVAPRITATQVSSIARTAEIHFTSSQAGVRFRCALRAESIAGRGAPRYSACASPARYVGLRPGDYDFFVRSYNSATGHSAAAERRIQIA